MKGLTSCGLCMCHHAMDLLGNIFPSTQLSSACSPGQNSRHRQGSQRLSFSISRSPETHLSRISDGQPRMAREELASTNRRRVASFDSSALYYLQGGMVASKTGTRAARACTLSRRHLFLFSLVGMPRLRMAKTECISMSGAEPHMATHHVQYDATSSTSSWSIPSSRCTQ